MGNVYMVFLLKVINSEAGRLAAANKKKHVIGTADFVESQVGGVKIWPTPK